MQIIYLIVLLSILSTFNCFNLQLNPKFINKKHLNMKIAKDYTKIQFLSKLTKTIASVVLSSIIIFNSNIVTSNAAVGEGDLPPGALAFTKVMKYQGDWKKLYETIKLRSNELTEQEVLGMKAFLKGLANEYSDLELLSKGIQNKDQQNQAISNAKDFRKLIRECDDAASNNNFNKILEIYPKTTELLDNILNSMQDVPDEL